MPQRAENSPPGRLAELAWVFLRLGAISVGGPPALIALMHDEIVTRRAWMTEDEFLDRLGATNLIPGPSATELTIFTGYFRAGWPGLVVAGVAYMLPAAAIVTAVAALYARYGTLPEVAGLLYGLKAAVIAIVSLAVWKLGRVAGKNMFVNVIGVAALLSTFAGVGPLAVIAGAGAVSGFAEWSKRENRGTPAALSLSVIALAVLVTRFTPPVLPTEPGGPIGIHNLFFYFLRTGAVIYGGGFVLIGFLQRDLVASFHWLTSKQLLDAVAVGQVTPGPIFTTATFIGYQLLGVPGAAVATLGIFLPSFFFCALSGPLIPALRRSAVAGAFLDGVNIAAVAVMAEVTWELARAALVDSLSFTLAVATGLVLFLSKVPAGWLLLACALVGLFAHRG